MLFLEHLGLSSYPVGYYFLPYIFYVFPRQLLPAFLIPCQEEQPRKTCWAFEERASAAPSVTAGPQRECAVLPATLQGDNDSLLTIEITKMIVCLKSAFFFICDLISPIFSFLNICQLNEMPRRSSVALLFIFSDFCMSLIQLASKTQEFIIILCPTYVFMIHAHNCKISFIWYYVLIFSLENSGYSFHTGLHFQKSQVLIIFTVDNGQLYFFPNSVFKFIVFSERTLSSRHVM